MLTSVVCISDTELSTGFIVRGRVGGVMLYAGKQNQTTNKRAEGECVRLCACLSLDHYVEYDFFRKGWFLVMFDFAC